MLPEILSLVAFHMLLISIIKIILSNFDTIKILISPVERRVGTPITWPVHTELSRTTPATPKGFPLPVGFRENELIFYILHNEVPRGLQLE